MALANILQQISNDAAEQAAAMSAKAEQQAALIAEQIKAEAAVAATDLKEKTATKEAALSKKIHSLASTEKREKVLFAKREVISEVFDEAKQVLSKLPAQKKEMILVQMLKDIDEPKGTIAPTKGSENAISEAIKKAGKDFQLGNPVAGSGGFIFQSNKVEIDYRFDTLLESNLQNRLEKEIFQKLFN